MVVPYFSSANRMSGSAGTYTSCWGSWPWTVPPTDQLHPQPPTTTHTPPAAPSAVITLLHNVDVYFLTARGNCFIKSFCSTWYKEPNPAHPVQTHPFATTQPPPASSYTFAPCKWLSVCPSVCVCVCEWVCIGRA